MESRTIAAFIGFCLPEELKVKADRLILNLREGVLQHQGALYAEVVEGLVDESMDTFFLEPIADIGISSVGERLVKTGVSSVKKAVSMLVNSLAKKLKNEEMKPLAEYLYSVIYTARPDENAVEQAYMASPIGHELDTELLSIVADIEAGETGEAIQSRLSVALLEVSEISLELFFAQPLKMVKLGFVMTKAGQVAFDATRAAIRGVIKKVFKGMNEAQLRGVAQYIRSVRFSRNLLLNVDAA